MDIKKIKGTKDYFGIEEIKLNKVLKILEEISKKYSYNKIITPTIEYTKLFNRAIGNDVDVINKEMYTFNDKKERSISLRPEGTAPTVRAAIENNLLDNNDKPSFYYISSMFRYERPQKGRQREFFQFGVENFGKDNEYVDVEIILMAIEILNRLKIDKYELQINSIGDSSIRKKYNKVLKDFMKEKIDMFSEYAKEKFYSGNLLGVFDSKKESDLLILKEAPKLKDFLSSDSKKRFQNIKNILNKQNITYKENIYLVRGLDYYNDLVFELVSKDVDKLGSQSTIIGGGRYDSLVNIIDEKRNIPSIGFALGIERLMLAASDYLNDLKYNNIDYYIATTNEEYNLLALFVGTKLRKKNNNVFINFEDQKLSKKMDQANKLGADKVFILGKETDKGKLTSRDLKSGDQILLKIEEI